jgi:Protein of unknown function (DUF998)
MNILSNPTKSVMSTSSGTDRFAQTGIGSVTVFIILLALLHFLEPEFDPSWRFVSEYALGQFGSVMSLAFVALAVGIGATARVACKHSKSLLCYVGAGILVLASVGLCIAAIFPTDAVNTPPGLATTAGKLHMIGASLDCTPLGALLISIALARNADWKMVRPYVVGTAILTIVTTIGFIASMPSDYIFGPGMMVGWWNRLIMLSYVCWIAVVCFNAILLSKRRA